MFDLMVFWFLSLLLFAATAAAVHMGVFRAARPGKSLKYKIFSGTLSAMFSGVAWFYMYGFRYLGW